MSLKKKVTALAVLIGVLALAGIGYAYWTTTGSGFGSASTTEGVTDTLAFDTTALDAMYPGDAEQTLTVGITNTDANEKVYVSTVKAYLEVTPAETGGDCDADDFLLNGVNTADSEANAVTLTWTAQELDAAGVESHDATGTIQFNNKPTTNQDDCKDAAVTIQYVAS